MGGKQVGYVLIALIVLGIAGIVVRLVSAETEKSVLSGVRPLNENEIDKVVMRDADNEVIVEKRGDRWWVGQYPVVQLKFEEMWDTAAAFNGAELIASNPDNHGLMGVSPENTTVAQFWKGDGLQEEFFVGDKQYAPIGEKPITPWTPYARLCYLRYPDKDDVYSIYCDFPDRFTPDHRFWADPIVAEVPLDEIEVITFNYPDQRFDLKVVQSVWVIQSGGTEQQADAEKVLELLRQLELVVTDDFPSQEEVSRLNFSISDITLRLGTREGSIADSVVLQFLVREEGDEDVGTSYYIKNASLPYVYILDGTTSEAMLKRVEDLLPEATPASTPTP